MFLGGVRIVVLELFFATKTALVVTERRLVPKKSAFFSISTAIVSGNPGFLEDKNGLFLN